MNRKLMVVSLIMGLFLCLLIPSQAATYYADIARPDDSGAGTSWGTAKKTIQAAVNLATNTETVLVASGLYNTGGLTNWPAGGLLTNRVAVTNAITLQAASTNPADTTIAGCPDPTTGSNGNAAVRGIYLAANAKLIGFTISNGCTKTIWGAVVPAFDGYGGGICAEANSIISNCFVITNTAAIGGGAYKGIFLNCRICYNYGSSGALYMSIVSNSVIAWNVGSWGGGAKSCTLYRCNIVSNYSTSHSAGAVGCTAIDCDFIANNAASHSSGMSDTTAIRCNIIGNLNGGVGISCVLDRCVIRQNSGGVAGMSGGFATNCLIVQNTASGYPAYVVGYGWGSYPIPRLINCTVVSNTAAAGKAAIVGGSLTNCIVYYNTPVDFNNTTCTVDYCCTSLTNAFTNSASGLNNITNAPRFAGTNDFHFLSGSPGIDAGMDLPGVITNDLDGFPRPKSGVIGRAAKWDMGCYEFLPRGTMLMLQ